MAAVVVPAMRSSASVKDCIQCLEWDRGWDCAALQQPAARTRRAAVFAAVGGDACGLLHQLQLMQRHFLNVLMPAKRPLRPGVSRRSLQIARRAEKLFVCS